MCVHVCVCVYVCEGEYDLLIGKWYHHKSHGSIGKSDEVPRALALLLLREIYCMQCACVY